MPWTLEIFPLPPCHPAQSPHWVIVSHQRWLSCIIFTYIAMTPWPCLLHGTTILKNNILQWAIHQVWIQHKGQFLCPSDYTIRSPCSRLCPICDHQDVAWCMWWQHSPTVSSQCIISTCLLKCWRDASHPQNRWGQVHGLLRNGCNTLRYHPVSCAFPGTGKWPSH